MACIEAKDYSDKLPEIIIGRNFLNKYLITLDGEEICIKRKEGRKELKTRSNSTIYENISWHTTMPLNTRIIMKVRTDMFPNMTHAKEWHECPEIESQDGVNKIPRSDLSSVSNGHRYVQYRAELRTWDPSKTPTLINVTVNFSSSLEGVILANSSGSITFASNYHYLPNHELTYENGAVVIQSQEGGGGFVLCPFNFSFNNATSGVPVINISLVNLTGTNVPAYSGAPSTFVRMFRGDYELISDSFYYPNLTLNISSTAYPSIWGKWFNETLKNSGLNESYYNPPVVNESAGTVVVEFYGHSGGVQLYLEKTTVEVTMAV